MFRKKITWKMTLMVFIILMMVTGSSIIVQFFFVSRFYVTTDYTRQRIETIQKRAEEISKYGFSELELSETSEIRNLLDRFEAENNVSCLLMNSTGDVICKSAQAEQMSPSYVSFVSEIFKSGQICNYEDSAFRIQNSWRFPTRFIGTYRTISFRDWRLKGVMYLIMITREVYTEGEYDVFRKFTVLMLGAALLVSCIVSVFFARKLTKPILQMETAARRMSNLDFSEKCTCDSRDELGNLAKSLNFLSEKLEESIGQLQLANCDLQKNLGIQKEIDCMRRNFMAMASHEFKTPLTLLRGYLEMMRDQILPQQSLQEAEEVMIEEIDRLDQLVLDMLELSRLESGMQEIQMVPFHVNELIEYCKNQFEQIFVSRKIQLHFLYDEKMNMIAYGDQSKIERVLTNFLSNALTHTPPGGEVEVRVDRRDDIIKISVFNQGNHIPEEALSRLWDPFYRTEDSRMKYAGGTGLGLSICKEILEKHKSEYGTENGQDGVLFFFTLKATL